MLRGMSSSPDPILWYSRHAAALGPVYDAIDPATLHGWLDGVAPAAPGLVLDVGAGIGRDAAWLAGLGHDVIAVEPSAAMRAITSFSQATMRLS